MEKRVLTAGEVAAANPPDVVPCLRIETTGLYDLEEDEFVAKTYFSHSPDAPHTLQPAPRAQLRGTDT